MKRWYKQTYDSSRDDRSQLEVMGRSRNGRCLLQKQKSCLWQDRVRRHLQYLLFPSIVSLQTLLGLGTVSVCLLITEELQRLKVKR